MNPKLSPKEILGTKAQALTTWRVFLWVSIPLLILDQITKQAILNNFALETGRGGGAVPVIPGLFNIVRVHNQGMAFGIGNGSPFANVIFLSVATAAIAFIAYLWRRDAFPNPVTKFAVASLIAGVLGNVTDRLRLGYVVDFLDFHIGESHFPSFNVADSCICVAAGLLIIASFRDEARERKAAKSKEQDKASSSEEAPSSSGSSD